MSLCECVERESKREREREGLGRCIFCGRGDGVCFVKWACVYRVNLIGEFVCRLYMRVE